jgi:hypothetical protein
MGNLIFEKLSWLHVYKSMGFFVFFGWNNFEKYGVLQQKHLLLKF